MSHVHAHRDEPYKCVEIDPHVCLQPIHGGGEGISRRNANGELEPVAEYFAGFIIGHDRAGIEHRCEGMVTVDRQGEPGPTWSMTGSVEGGDLTLSPSILCVIGSGDYGARCGFHGFVQNGKWVPV